MAAADDETRTTKGRVIAERYALGEEIGRGGASIVYAATDGVTGRQVALKLLHADSPQIGNRARREIAALRLLRLPGVVTLQDEGTDGGAPFLVMDLVEGVPFPGRAAPIEWPGLAAPTLSMLEVLARVHAAGVVHRDLKPSNVFVGDDLNVTLLDFGISWGPALGEALTAVGGIVGTPEYLAPEQLAGVRGDPRSDLYTVGVLLYEALTGKLPHEAETFGELTHQKMTVTPLPVRQRASDTPRRVAQTVERLLARDPEDRPQSVGELMHQLFDREVTERMTSVLPRLGESELPVRIAERVLSGESVDVSGPLGTGRSRTLTDVAEALAARGRHPRWTPSGTAPFASALALFEGITDVETLMREELEARLVAEFEKGAQDGVVFLVDDPDQVDAWSAGLIAAALPLGGFVRVVPEPTPGCVQLTRLTETELRPLFAGPDRIFHLREDGAAELFRRTGGLPSRVAEELGAWVRAGLARWHDGKVVVTRDALQRLAGGLPTITSTRYVDDEPDAPGLQELLAWITLAWPHTTEDVLARATQRPPWRLQPELEELHKRHRITRLEDGRYQPVASSAALQSWPEERVREAHRCLADTLAPGTPERLRHLAVAGSSDEIVAEARKRGDRLIRQGRYSDALVALEMGLVAARRAGDAEGEHALLLDIAHACLDDGARSTIQQGLYDLGRAIHRDEELTRLEELLVLARDAESAPPHELMDRLDRLGPLRDLNFELWRRSQQYRVSPRLGPTVEASTIREVEAWAAASDRPFVKAAVESWRMLAQAHLGEPADAAHAQEAAALAAKSATMRMTDLVNAGYAYTMIGDADSAARVACAVRDEASACRAAEFEAHAECLLRIVAYQRDAAGGPDLALVQAVSALAYTSLTAQATMTEAAIAWRAGDLETGRELSDAATDACLRWAEPDTDLVPRALAIVCGRETNDAELQELERAAAKSEDADTAVQTLGLLAAARPAQADRLHALAAERAKELEWMIPGVRGVVLSVREATGRTPCS